MERFLEEPRILAKFKLGVAFEKLGGQTEMTKPPWMWITEEAWELIQVSKSIALAEEASEILTRHLLQGCAIEASNLMRAALTATELSGSDIERCIRRIQPDDATHPDPFAEQRRLSSPAEEVIHRARELTREHPAGAGEQVTPVHLWASICSAVDELREWLLERGWPEDCIRRLPEVARAQLPQRRPSRSILKGSELQVLKRFCSRDLTELARREPLTEAYGVEEIREGIVHCLLRKNKRSVVLTGPAGVGKTKLVEDLAVRISKGEIPGLEGCQVFEFDLALFTRGTHLVGSRAERWAQLTEVLRAHPEGLILFIDELHTIVGLPLEGQAMDLSNALKPLLVDEKVRIIGATTPDEYRRYIEGDPALARRFTEIKIPEPDRDRMREILKKAAPHYEECHGVRYPTDTLEAIYDLARSSLPNQSFPAKAIDLMDEVGVRVKMRSPREASPSEQPGPVSAVQPEDVRETLKRIWGFDPESFKESVKDIAGLLQGKVVGQDRAANKLFNVAVTSTYRYGKEERKGPRGVILFTGPPGVGKSFMAQVFSEILFPGRDSLLTLDMTEFSGSHSGEHARFRLLGPEPPYVGWETGGLLTSHALQHPVSVVLIDEFEKASPEARNVLLRIFNDGWAQDGRGRIVSFRGIYFILTANAGRKLWEPPPKEPVGIRPIPDPLGSKQKKPVTGALSDEQIRQVLLEEGVSPELLSRISHMVLFDKLTEEHLKKIACLKLAGLRDSAWMEDSLLLEYDEEVLSQWLVERSATQQDCRRLTAFFETTVETPLAHWRMGNFNRNRNVAILRLELTDKGVEPTLDEKHGDEGRIEQLLFERVAALFAQKQQHEQHQQAARVLLGTSA